METCRASRFCGLGSPGCPGGTCWRAEGLSAPAGPALGQWGRGSVGEKALSRVLCVTKRQLCARFSCCLRGPSCAPRGRLLDLGRDPQGWKLPLLSRDRSPVNLGPKGLGSGQPRGARLSPVPCSGCRASSQPPPSCGQSRWGSSVLSGLCGPWQF